MKTLIIIFLSFLFISVQQKKVEGEYFDYFGNNLKLNEDFTFSHKWNIDLSGGWCKGTWKIENDTIYFTIVPIFDTLRISGKNDSLVLSQTEIPRVIDSQAYSISLLASGGQNKAKIDEKLYYKNDKLYRIDKYGKLETKKVNSILDFNRKANTWFERKR